MQIYFAGGFPYFTPEELKNFYNLGIKRRLFSYHFINTDQKMYDGFKFVCEKYNGTDYEIMIDSGAFTVAMKDQIVDIDKYAEFLLKYKNNITVAVNLDVVTKGRSSHEKLQKAAQEGWENLKYLEGKGLSILPVYHSGEDYKWLKMMMNDYKYIGVSRTGDVEGVSERLNQIFTYLVDQSGRSKWRVHGFGVTSPTMMRRWPWTTVDSSSWVKYGCYGVIVMFKDGAFKSIGMSDRKLTLWAKKGQHYNNLNPTERKMWDEEMEKRGVTRDILQDNRTRDMWNIQSFLQLEEWLSKNETTFKGRRSLFG